MPALNEQEVMTEALRIAQDIRSGAIGPIGGAAQIWMVSSENNRACFDDLKGFIAAANGPSDDPAHRAEYADDARREAAELLARHGM